MGLKVNLTTSQGVVLENAYVTVDTLKSKHLFKGAQIIVQVFNSAADKPKYIDRFKINMNENDAAYADYLSAAVVDAANVSDTIQGYNYIKSLDGTQEKDHIASDLAGIDFTAAIDV